MNRVKLHGFTLLEIMVVILIIGLVAGMTVPTLSLGGTERLARDEAVKFGRLLSLARDESILSRQNLLLRFNNEGYGFYRLEGKNVTEVEDDSLLKPRTYPDLVKVEVNVDNRGRKSGKKRSELFTQVYISSSGEMSPVEVRFAIDGSDAVYTVITTLMGEVTLQRPAEENGSGDL
ncbi:MAG: GspH family T2SS minor pseudopilin variant XcpU [Gammaproteobacteria bacterium]|nr:MAG: GspH family T2SS minor pseudopilin variant XcpU [Gammaproteobacteria bacterium]